MIKIILYNQLFYIKHQWLLPLLENENKKLPRIGAALSLEAKKFGNPATIDKILRSEVLRPHFSMGLPFRLHDLEKKISLKTYREHYTLPKESPKLRQNPSLYPYIRQKTANSFQTCVLATQLFTDSGEHDFRIGYKYIVIGMDGYCITRCGRWM